MAISEFLEPAIKDYATQAKATYSAPIDTSKFAQKVAPQDAMTTQAAGLATQGVGSYQPYLQAAQTAQTQGPGLWDKLHCSRWIRCNSKSSSRDDRTTSLSTFHVALSTTSY